MHMIDLNRHTLEVQLAARCVGLTRAAPYVRREKKWYRPYRNYFAAKPLSEECTTWDGLVDRGLAKRTITDDYYFYSLTAEGRAWLGRELDVHIYDEEGN